MLNVAMLGDVILNVFMPRVIKLNVAMLSGVMLNVFMQNVVKLNVAMLSVVAPCVHTLERLVHHWKYRQMGFRPKKVDVTKNSILRRSE